MLIQLIALTSLTSLPFFFYWRGHRKDVEEANSGEVTDLLIAAIRKNQQDSDRRTELESKRLLEQEETQRQRENERKEREREVDEQVRQLKQDAEENQRLHQEKMSQNLQKSNENFKKFANTINTRLQWQQQDQEWSNWLQNIRRSIAEVLSTGEGNEALQSILCSSFSECQHWYAASSVSEDKNLFLLIIMKSISQVSEINEKLYGLTSENNSMRPGSEISKVLHELSVDMIPTTTKLKEIESNADQNNYKNIVEPHPLPSTSVIIEEIND